MTHDQVKPWLQCWVSRMPRWCTSTRSVPLVLSVFLVLLILVGTVPQSAQASGLNQTVQTDGETPTQEFGPSLRPNNQLPRWLLDELAADNSPAAGVTAADRPQRPPAPTDPSLIIDSDFGVDDTVAVAALISLDQGIATIPISIPVKIQALVTVAGVTTVENATYNAQLLLAQYGLDVDDIPVVVGAKKPLKQDLSSTGKLIHGPDGLWWLAQITQEQELDATFRGGEGKGPSTKATNFYCNDANLSGATLLTLGPLTNVAEAIKRCGNTFANAEGLQLVVLGGVDMTGTESPPMGNETPIIGNTTPVTEYNFWQDPEAAQYVFDFAKPKNPGDMPVLNITVIPQNTFAQYVLTFNDIVEMGFSPNAVGRWLTRPVYGFPYDPPLPPYENFWGPLPIFYGVQAENGIAPGIPDLVAAAYAVDPAIQQSALVTPSVVTIIGDSKASGFAAGESLMAQSIMVPAFDPMTGDYLGFEIPLGTTEQISQVYDDKTLSNLADAVFANGQPFNADSGLLNDFLFGAILAPPNNAQVVAKIDPALVRDFLLGTLTVEFSIPNASAVNTSGEDALEGATPDERIFMPFVTTE